LIDGDPSEADIEFAARLVARYSQGRSAEQVTLEFTDSDGKQREIKVTPMPPHEIPKEWII
jgi:predicted ribosome quality control (RQC) complex YloA/Tae2 family protein